MVWSAYTQSKCAGSCSNHSFLIPFLLALPYILRFIQCIIVHRALNDTSQFFNAIKYTTALPVVFLSFVKYSVPLTSWHSFWKPLWVASAVVNSSYSFYWDVERDWDIRLFHPGAMPPDTTRQRCLTYRCSLLHNWEAKCHFVEGRCLWVLQTYMHCTARTYACSFLLTDLRERHFSSVAACYVAASVCKALYFRSCIIWVEAKQALIM